MAFVGPCRHLYVVLAGLGGRLRVSVSSESHRYRTHQWWMMALAAVCFFASAPGQSFLISVFVDEFLAGTGLSRTAFSGLYAAGTVVSAMSMLALGRVVDRHGLRAAWTAVTVALAAACGIASAATGALGAFIALAMLRTFGQGSFPLVGTLIVTRSFERRRGQAMAAANLGVTVASVVLPPLTVALILAAGWRHAYQLLGLSLLLFVLPLAWLVRPGPPRSQRDGGDGTDSASFPRAMRQSSRLPRLALPTRGAGQALFVLAAPPLVGTALTFHAVSILGERGLSFVQAGFALSALGVASAVGTVLIGAVADRFSTRALLIVVSMAVLLGSSVLLVPHAYAAYVAFAVLGLGMGGNGVVNGMVWARTYGLAQIGRIQGTAQSSMITAAAVAPLVPALSQGIFGGYVPALLALCAFTGLTLVAAIGWQDPRRTRAVIS